MPNEQLKKNIMRRVYTVYLFRSVAQPLLFELALVGAFIGVTAFFVSLKSIVSNAYALESFTALGQFLFSAFLHTQIIVQTTLVGLAIIAGIFIWDFFRRVRRYIWVRRA
jgi:hypothetical protein